MNSAANTNKHYGLWSILRSLIALFLLIVATLWPPPVIAQSGVQVELRLVIEHVVAPHCFEGDWDACERIPELYAFMRFGDKALDTPPIDSPEIRPTTWTLAHIVALNSSPVTGSIEIRESDDTTSDDEADIVAGPDRIINFTVNPSACMSLAPDAVTGNFGASKGCNVPILSDGNGQNPTHIQFRIAMGPSLVVRDETGVPVADAEIWHLRNETKTILHPDSNGQLFVPDLQQGDKLVAMQLVQQEAVTDSVHDGWSHRVYRTSFTYDSNGDALPEIVTPQNCCSSPLALTVKKRSPLVLFNLVVSVGWDSYGAYEATTQSTFLKDLKSAFIEANRILFDMTDGHFAFGAIKIYDGAQHWADADIQVAPSNYVRPYANAGGITAHDAFTYTSPVGNVTVFYPGHIRIGRAWDRYGHPDALWSDSDGYRTLVHEFAHYALMLFDEYFYINQAEGKIEEAFCEGSIMFRSYAHTELDMQNAAPEAWQEDCRKTEQFSVHGVSAWETVADVYADMNVPPRWEFRLPEPGKLPKIGPEQLPFSLASITIMPPPQDPHLANGTGEVTLTVRTSQGQPLPTAHPQIFLIRNLAGAWQIIEQGTTNENGVIELTGVKPNDLFFGTTWDGKLFGSQLYQTGTSASLYLAQMGPGQWPPMITAQPINNPTTTVVGITVAASQLSSVGGELIATLLPVGHGPVQTIRLTADSAKKMYSGNFTFTQEQTLGEAHIWLREVHPGTEDVIGNPPHQIITTYALGGSPDSYKRLNPPKDPTSSDGYCQFHFPNADWTQHLPAIVLPSRGLPELAGHQIVSAGCYMGVAGVGNGAPTDSFVFQEPIPLTIYYNALATKGIDDATLKIYRWNATAERWQPVVSNPPDERNYFITGTTQQPGLFVAAAPLPTQLALSERLQASIGVVNAFGSPERVSAANTLEICPNASALVISATGIKRFYANAKSYVNNLSELQPGETYFVGVDKNCSIDMSAREKTGALVVDSPTVEQTKAITLSMATMPATFYGPITGLGQSLLAGLAVTAYLNEQMVAQGNTFIAQGETVFVLDILADDLNTPTIEGGQPGQTVTFRVNGISVPQTAIWQPGVAQQVNVTVAEVFHRNFLPLIAR